MKNKKRRLITVLKGNNEIRENVVLKATKRTGLWLVVKKKNDKSVFDNYKIGSLFYVKPKEQIELKGNDVCFILEEFWYETINSWEHSFKNEFSRLDYKHEARNEEEDQSLYGEGEDLKTIHFNDIPLINNPCFLLYSFKNKKISSIWCYPFSDWGFNHKDEVYFKSKYLIKFERRKGKK